MKFTFGFLPIFLFSNVLMLSACSEEEKILKPSSPGDTNKVVDNNPVITDVYTADPAVLVHDGTFYLYAGHDEQEQNTEGFLMNDWLVFSTTDLVNWENHGPGLAATDFDWATGQAWASHVVEKDGKFWWYTTVEHNAAHPGKAIGVAVSDNPAGPFEDALGKALINNDMTSHIDDGEKHYWDDIDPAVFIDDDGEAYLYWGNTQCKWAKLKDNMIELDGSIHAIDLPEFTEGPWVHKRGDMYYMTYAAGWPERIDYATSDSPEGPWEPRGLLNDTVPGSPTNHPAVAEYKGDWYFIYHTGNLPGGGEFRRSVCIDYLHYNEDGTLKKVVQTDRGVDAVED